MAITLVTAELGLGACACAEDYPTYMYVHIHWALLEVEHACLYGDCWIVQVFTYVYMIHGDKRCGKSNNNNNETSE